MTPSFRGFVDEAGRLALRRPERFKAHLQTMKSREVVVTVERETHRRSLAQNAYYHGVIVDMIARHTGEDHDAVHDFLKTKFLSRPVNIGGEEQKAVGSTTNLSTEKFEEYLERCRAWAAQFLELTIPMPNDINIDIQ